MTRYVISMLVAILFLVMSLSLNIIPCNTFTEFCHLDGEQSYYFTDKLSDPLYAGLITFVIIFLLTLFLTYFLVPPPR